MADLKFEDSSVGATSRPARQSALKNRENMPLLRSLPSDSERIAIKISLLLRSCAKADGLAGSLPRAEALGYAIAASRQIGWLPDSTIP
jgi:hypothetical protein